TGPLGPRDKKGSKNQSPAKGDPKIPTPSSAQTRRNTMIPIRIKTVRREPLVVRSTKSTAKPVIANRRPATKKSARFQSTSLENCIKIRGMDKINPTRPRMIDALLSEAMIPSFELQH